MENTRFSIGDAFRHGWDKTLANLGFMIAAFVLVIFVYIALASAQYVLEDAVLLAFIIGLAGAVVGTVIEMGFFKIALKAYDDQPLDYGDLFAHFHLFFKYFAAAILYGLMVFIGFILLIIPGIMLAIQFYFSFYFIVDKELGPLEALDKSSAITRGARWDIFVFFLGIFILNIAGALVFLIGLFITIPMTLFATAYVYRKLLSSYEEATSANVAAQS
ncbi:MAG: hypothetical protein DWQ05_07045 [Calditrichaeota bacterium]|nr:MAG: hypothetical protein DWQ05_07045 [Calditrichota bacterium]